MSLVRISKQLLKDVESTISSIKQKDYAANVGVLNPKEDAALSAKLFEEGERLIWGEHMHYKTTLPKAWLSHIDRMDVSVVDAKGYRIGDEIQISKKVTLPPNHPHSYGYVEVKVPVGRLPPEFVAQYEAFKAAKEAFDAKYDTIQAQVLGFLKSCKSLNDALKKYPDIALYVPEKYLSVVNEVRERGEREKKDAAPAVQLDRDMLSATGVLGKLQS
jgi:hypothetical protein